MSLPLSVFIPAYNAEDTISSVIYRIPKETWNLIEAVIVINDGSTDNTAMAVTDLRQTYPKLTLNSSEVNQGYGAVVKQGLKLCFETGTEFIACLHADGQYPPEELCSFISHMRRNKIDVLQGSRHKEGTALQGGMPLYKYIAGKILTSMENRIFGLQMTDYHSGYMFYSRRAVSKVPVETLSPYFDCDLEFIAYAKKRGLKIGELGIPTHYGNEKSYLNPIVYGLKTLNIMGKYLTGCYNPTH